MSTPAPPLADWVGRTESRSDLVTAHAVAALAATLDHDPVDPPLGSEAPPLMHWLLFPPLARASEVGPDGHPRRGGFLPPVPLPRRMWAGSRIEFHHPLRVGDEASRTSRIAAVESKQGRGGALAFVTVQHEVHDARGLSLSEHQDIVYREAAAPGSPPPSGMPAPAAQFEREVDPDPVLLFRYSALTFNGHRIHYDRSYVTEVEGYPGLVVHGPLIATLLVDLLQRERPGLRLRRFAFRAIRPLFDIHRFAVCGRSDGGGRIALWASDHEGQLAMQAEAIEA